MPIVLAPTAKLPTVKVAAGEDNLHPQTAIDEQNGKPNASGRVVTITVDKKDKRPGKYAYSQQPIDNSQQQTFN